MNDNSSGDDAFPPPLHFRHPRCFPARDPTSCREYHCRRNWHAWSLPTAARMGRRRERRADRSNTRRYSRWSPSPAAAAVAMTRRRRDNDHRPSILLLHRPPPIAPIVIAHLEDVLRYRKVPKLHGEVPLVTTGTRRFL